MRLLNFLGKSPDEKDRANVSKLTPEEVELWRGGMYIQPATFQQLVSRIGAINTAVDWHYCLVGSAGGNIIRAVNPRELNLGCSLAPVRRRDVVGLQFRAQIGAVPPPTTWPRVQETLQYISASMLEFTGSNIYVHDQALWFSTIVTPKDGEFSDEVLTQLVASNLSWGEMAFRALAAVHQGVLAPDDGFQDFWQLYSRYVNGLSSQMRKMYERSCRDQS